MIARLDATRNELLEAGERRAVPATSRNARRRRVASLVTVAVLGVGGVGAGAAALVTGSTGVPAVDRFLGTYEAEPDEDNVSGGRRRAVQPDSSGDSTTVEIRLGARRLISTSYVARDGRFCTVLTDAGVEAAADVVCADRESLTARLERDGGVVIGIEDKGDTVVMRGFVRDRASTLVGRGPGGPLEVRLGGTWTPPVSDVGSVRPFVATGGSAAEGLHSDDYVLRAIDNDGNSTEISP